MHAHRSKAGKEETTTKTHCCVKVALPVFHLTLFLPSQFIKSLCRSTKTLQTVPPGLLILSPNFYTVIRGRGAYYLLFVYALLFLNHPHTPRLRIARAEPFLAGRTSWSVVGSPSHFTGEHSNPLTSESHSRMLLHRGMKMTLMAFLQNLISLGRKKECKMTWHRSTYHGHSYPASKHGLLWSSGHSAGCLGLYSDSFLVLLLITHTFYELWIILLDSSYP